MSKHSKRNASGAGMIRKRSDGRWEGRYTLGFDPKTGKQRQRSIYGATQHEVRQKLTQILSEIDDGSYVEPSSMKLETWLDIWLKEYTVNLKPTTYSCYESSVRVHLKPNLGRFQLSTLAPHMIQHFYAAAYCPPMTDIGL